MKYTMGGMADAVTGNLFESLATFEVNNDRTGVTERHVHRRMFDDRIDLTFYVDAGKYLPIKFFEK